MLPLLMYELAIGCYNRDWTSLLERLSVKYNYIQPIHSPLYMEEEDNLNAAG